LLPKHGDKKAGSKRTVLKSAFERNNSLINLLTRKEDGI